MTEFLQVNRENRRNSVGTVIEYFNPTLKTCLLIVVAHLDCSDFNSWTSLCFSSNMTSYPAGFFPACRLILIQQNIVDIMT